MKENLLLIFSLVHDISNKTELSAGLYYADNQPIKVFVRESKTSIHTVYNELITSATDLNTEIARLETILANNLIPA